MEPIDFKKLFDFSDDTEISKAIKSIESLSGIIERLESISARMAGEYTHALDDISKSAGKLDSEMEDLDATLVDHQKLILAGAQQAEKLIAAQDATTKSLELERQSAEKLRAAEDALSKSKDDLSKINTKEAGTLGTLRAQLEKAVQDVKNMGDATDSVVKQAAIDRVSDLAKQVNTADAAFKQSTKVVNLAAGSYDALVMEVDAAKKELKAMEGGIGSNSARFKELQKTVKDGSEKLKEFDQEVGDARDSSADYGDAIGQIDQATGGALSGVKKLASGFKLLYTTPLGIFLLAIVGALKSLQEYFTGTVEGQDEWNKLLRQGEAILETFLGYLEDFGKFLFEALSQPKKTLNELWEFIAPVREALISMWNDPLQALKDFGTAIVDNILNRFKSIGVVIEAVKLAIDGDIVGSLKKMADAGIQAVTGVTNGTDKIVDAYNAVADAVGSALTAIEEEAARRLKLADQIAKLENQIRKDKIADVVDDAQTELDVYKLLNQAQDKLRYSANERFAAQKKAGQLLQDQLAGDLKLIRDEIQLQKLVASQTDDNYEAREKLAQLQAEEIGLQSAYEKAFKKRQATERQLLEEAEKDRLGAIKREQDAARLLGEVVTKARIESNNETIADDRTTLSDRIALINENAEYSLELSESVRDRDLSAAKEAAIERVEIDADTLDRIYSMQGASADQINAARRTAAEAAIKTDQAYIDEVLRLEETFKNETIRINDEAVEETADNVFKQWEQDFKNFQDRVDIRKSFDIIGLNDDLAAGLITYKEYQEARQEIQDAAQIESLESQLKYLQKIAAQMAAAGHDVTALEQQIADTQRAISDAKNQNLIDGQILLDQKIKELKQVAYDTALTFIESGNEAEDMRREERLAKLEENYALETQMAGDNDAAKLEATNRFNLEKDKIDKEQRAADRKRAIFQKTLAAVEIAINTAKGIGMALGSYIPPVSFALAAVIGVIGALQIAAVLSKPIPAFAEGTDSAPGGWSLINEQGSEAVTDSKGTRVYHSKGPALVNLERGAIVHTAEETARIMAGDKMIAGFDDDTQKMKHIKIEVDNDKMTRALMGGLGQINTTLQQQSKPVLDPRGLAREIARGFSMSSFEANEYR